MNKYKVIALSVSGRSNKVYKSGDEVDENKFLPGMAEKLCELKFLERVYAENLKPEIAFPIVGRLKLAIVTAVWKRPEVFELFAKGIHALTVNTAIDIYVIVAGSEGKASQKMVEKHGFIYVEVPNEPLATKVNQPVLIAKRLKVDYVLCLGSDDLISIELLKVYEEYMRKGIDFIAVTDFYFYDMESKKAAYWGGYTENWRKGHTAGAGRLLSKRLLNYWDWKPWEIKDSKILDTSIQNKLKITPHSSMIFSLKDKGVFALDIKSETNMTPFKLWDNTRFVPVETIKKHFPYVCAE